MKGGDLPAAVSLHPGSDDPILAGDGFALGVLALGRRAGAHHRRVAVNPHDEVINAE